MPNPANSLIIWRPQRDSNPCCRRERAIIIAHWWDSMLLCRPVSKTTQKQYDILASQMNLNFSQRGETWYVSFSHNKKQHRLSCKTTERQKAVIRGRGIAMKIAGIPSARAFQSRRNMLTSTVDVDEWQEIVSDAALSKSSWLGLLHRRALDRSRRRKIDFSLSFDQIAQLAMVSGGHCQVSGIKFNFDRGSFKMAPFAPSLDRINSRRGYTRSNTRLVCTCVNTALGQWGDDVFWKMIELTRTSGEVLPTHTSEKHTSP